MTTGGGGGDTLYSQLQAIKKLVHKLNCIEGKDKGKVPVLNQVLHPEIVSIP
jgi:hypothetical protein